MCHLSSQWERWVFISPIVPVLHVHLTWSPAWFPDCLFRLFILGVWEKIMTCKQSVVQEGRVEGRLFHFRNTSTLSRSDLGSLSLLVEDVPASLPAPGIAGCVSKPYTCCASRALPHPLSQSFVPETGEIHGHLFLRPIYSAKSFVGLKSGHDFSLCSKSLP